MAKNRFQPIQVYYFVSNQGGNANGQKGRYNIFRRIASRNEHIVTNILLFPNEKKHFHSISTIILGYCSARAVMRKPFRLTSTVQKVFKLGDKLDLTVKNKKSINGFFVNWRLSIFQNRRYVRNTKYGYSFSRIRIGRVCLRSYVHLNNLKSIFAIFKDCFSLWIFIRDFEVT